MSDIDWQARWRKANDEANELVAEVQRLRAGIEQTLAMSREMQRTDRSSVTLAVMQEALGDLLDPPMNSTDQTEEGP